MVALRVARAQVAPAVGEVGQVWHVTSLDVARTTCRGREQCDEEPRVPVPCVLCVRCPGLRVGV